MKGLSPVCGAFVSKRIQNKIQKFANTVITIQLLPIIVFVRNAFSLEIQFLCKFNEISKGENA